jgi:hypothetical protein
MAHKSKAMSDISFSQTDPPEAYSNPSIHTRIHDYTAMGKALVGVETPAGWRNAPA